MPFYALEGLTQRETEEANTRVFEGDGTPYLKVPGLREVTGVRVGTREIPLTAPLEFPVDPSGTQLLRTEEPMVSLHTGNDGVPVLLRNTRSNDGVWQAGPVYVSGVWEDEPAEEVRRGPGRPRRELATA